MTGDSKNLIAAVIDDAEEMQDTVVDTAQSRKPRLARGSHSDSHRAHPLERERWLAGEPLENLVEG